MALFILITQVLPEAKIELLEAIANIWTQYPELRLAQLIINAINHKSPSSDIFYTEDHTLLQKLKLLVSGNGK